MPKLGSCACVDVFEVHALIQMLWEVLCWRLATSGTLQPADSTGFSHLSNRCSTAGKWELGWSTHYSRAAPCYDASSTQRIRKQLYFLPTILIPVSRAGRTAPQAPAPQSANRDYGSANTGDISILLKELSREGKRGGDQKTPIYEAKTPESGAPGTAPPHQPQPTAGPLPATALSGPTRSPAPVAQQPRANRACREGGGGSTTDSSYWSREVRAGLEDACLLRYWWRELSVRGEGRGLAASGAALNAALGRGNGARGRRRLTVSAPPAARRAARGRERRGGRPHLSPGAHPSLFAAAGLRLWARSLAVAAGLRLCFRVRRSCGDPRPREGGRLRAVPPAARRCADGCRLPSGRWAGAERAAPAKAASGRGGKSREGPPPPSLRQAAPRSRAACGGSGGAAAGGCGWGPPPRAGRGEVRGQCRTTSRFGRGRTVGKSVGVRRGYRERCSGAAVPREGSCERCPVGPRAALPRDAERPGLPLSPAVRGPA